MKGKKIKNSNLNLQIKNCSIGEASKNKYKSSLLNFIKPVMTCFS